MVLYAQNETQAGRQAGVTAVILCRVTDIERKHNLRRRVVASPHMLADAVNWRGEAKQTTSDLVSGFVFANRRLAVSPAALGRCSNR